MLPCLAPLRKAQPTSSCANAVVNSRACLAVPVPPARLPARLSFRFHLLTRWNPHLGSGLPAENEIRIFQTLSCKANQDTTQLSI